jgi:hypothetical protein
VAAARWVSGATADLHCGAEAGEGLAVGRAEHDPGPRPLQDGTASSTEAARRVVISHAATALALRE